MNAEDVIRDAQERTDVHDLHTDSFREGLGVVEEVVNTEIHSAVSERRITIECTKSLMSRLRVDDWLARHPNVAGSPVERPVFVIGMPRTGTTVLVNLIAQDRERCRVLWHWEMDEPTPPVEQGHLHDDPRIARKVAKMAPLVERLSHFPRIEQAADPVECVHVLAQDFKSMTWQTSTGSSRYNDWLLDQADLRSAYAHHRRTLQVLQSGGAGGQWVLKLPSHALHLEALLAVYPDARLVMTHRDPLPALVSMCSYAEMIQAANGHRFDRADIVALTRRQVLESAMRPIEFLAAHPEVPCYHVYQDELAADPLGQVAKLRAWIGLPPDDRLDGRMQEYLATEWSHPPGSHRYTADDFTITRAEVNENFAPYLDRFHIDSEDR
jgi:Sulfotransferase family